MPYFVYILFSERDKNLYTGYSEDLKSRVKRHQSGFARATKYRLPIKLIYYECYLDKLDAKRREKFLKGGKGKNELKIQLQNIFRKLRYKHMAG